MGWAQGGRQQGRRHGQGAASAPALAIAGKVDGHKVRGNSDSGGLLGWSQSLGQGV